MTIELPLAGAGGEPISFLRTVRSHGCASLPPASVDQDVPAYDRSLRLGGRVVRVRFTERNATLVASPAGNLTAASRRELSIAATRMFRLEDDLAPFYLAIKDDPLLSWAAAGAGRLLASPTVFEDVVKTICTTNCAWSGTVRMCTALVELGGGAFPEPAALAGAGDAWFVAVARMGYRGPYVKQIAGAVASGELDLEELLPRFGKSDAEVRETLVALPGVGPYAAAHIMQLLGRHRDLILDSWTRPTYLRLVKKKQSKDSTIRRAFSRYGEYAGLAFWLFLTRGWVDEA